MPRPFFSRGRVWLLGLALLLLLVGFATAGPPKPSTNPPGTFAFAALGDAPYYLWEDIKYPLVLRDLDQHALSFGWTRDEGGSAPHVAGLNSRTAR